MSWQKQHQHQHPPRVGGQRFELIRLIKRKRAVLHKISFSLLCRHKRMKRGGGEGKNKNVFLHNSNIYLSVTAVVFIAFCCCHFGGCCLFPCRRHCCGCCRCYCCCWLSLSLPFSMLLMLSCCCFMTK